MYACILPRWDKRSNEKRRENLSFYPLISFNQEDSWNSHWFNPQYQYFYIFKTNAKYLSIYDQNQKKKYIFL